MVGVMKFGESGLPKSLLEPFHKNSDECSLDLQLLPSSFFSNAFIEVGSIINTAALPNTSSPTGKPAAMSYATESITFDVLALSQIFIVPKVFDKSENVPNLQNKLSIVESQKLKGIL